MEYCLRECLGAPKNILPIVRLSLVISVVHEAKRSEHLWEEKRVKMSEAPEDQRDSG